MKTAFALLLIALAIPTAFARGGGGSHSSHSSSGHSSSTHSSGGSHEVSGHYTKNGTYVAPHHATNPNGTKLDNWSTRGNVNLYTGKEGTKSPD